MSSVSTGSRTPHSWVVRPAISTNCNKCILHLSQGGEREHPLLDASTDQFENDAPVKSNFNANNFRDRIESVERDRVTVGWIERKEAKVGWLSLAHYELSRFEGRIGMNKGSAALCHLFGRPGAGAVVRLSLTDVSPNDNLINSE